MKKEQVLAKIRAAFDGAEPGKVGMHEAEVIDCYGSSPGRESARSVDAHVSSWEMVSDESFEASSGALSHLDKQGWLFYLLAFMSWSLRDFKTSESIVSDSTVYALMPWAADERHKATSKPQRQAVSAFPRFASERDDFFDAVVARKASNRYWSQLED